MSRFLQLICVFVCLGAISGVAQDAADHGDDLARVSRELKETRSQLQDARKQIDDLRKDMEALRTQVLGGSKEVPASAIRSGEADASAVPQTPPADEPTTAAADQDTTFLAAKIAELHQDKVESGSKYPVKLSGLILFNSYWNSGAFDIADLPSLAFLRSPGSPEGNVGATLRQTMLSISANGPRVFGARTSANIDFDFAGGSPTTQYGVTAGLVRLRTGQVRLDWKKTSLSVGQDSLFFSPLSPTSFATLLEPAFSWSGNLWVWTPQIEIEHRISLSDTSSLILQGGLLDPLTEEQPPFQGRVATAGEATRVPAVGGRVAYQFLGSPEHPITMGFGGYRAKQKYQSFDNVASWTLNADFRVPVGKHFEASGEWYQGQAVGGLGGGIWTSVVYSDPTFPQAAIHPLRSTGGWAQLKVRPEAHTEFNAAFGQDENYGSDLRFFPVPYMAAGYSALQKNRTAFLNFIYSPQSFLLFAVEYRHLFTAPPIGEAASGDHFNLAAGVRF